MTHNCIEEVVEAIDRLIAKSEERKTEFKKDWPNKSSSFWEEVNYCNGLKAAKDMINSHYDCMA